VAPRLHGRTRTPAHVIFLQIKRFLLNFVTRDGGIDDSQVSRISSVKRLHQGLTPRTVCTVSPERNGTDREISMAGKRIDAIAYLRTSSAANVGSDKDSDKRQRAAIASFAKAHGYRIVDEFYDSAVSGADPVAERPGFKAMLDRIAGNGMRVILVESPDRFARDLSVQITGHDYLRSLGVELVPTSAPDFFTTDTPTAVLVRQVLGAVSQFEKANLVAKLRAARERKAAAGGRGSGRFTYAQRVPEVVGLVHELHAQRQSLRQISKTLAAQGHLTGGGRPYTATAVQKMLRGG
jgi:DNA invertase Pin-like site-specific DNA recombinase